MIYLDENPKGLPSRDGGVPANRPDGDALAGLPSRDGGVPANRPDGDALAGQPCESGHPAILRLILSVLFFAGLIVGCGGGGDSGGGSPVGAIAGGTIQGKVTASGTISLGIRTQGATGPGQTISGSSGIPDAEVWILDLPELQVRTDKNGNFTLSGIPMGSPHMVVCRFRSPTTGELFITRSTPITLTSQAPAQDLGPLQVEKGSNAVSGILHDMDGKPIGGAKLVLWGIAFQSNPDGTFLTPTLPPSSGEEEITVSAAGFLSRSFKLPFFASQVVPFFDIVLPAQGEVNIPPIVYLAKVSNEVMLQGEVSLQAFVIDPDEIDPYGLKPQWSTSAGKITETSNPYFVTWQAPGDAGLATVSIQVTDSRGAPAKAQMAFIVGGVANFVLRVNSFSPSFGSPGTTVSIVGNGFGNKPDDAKVVFNGVSATIVSWSENQIVVTAPAQTTSGLIVLTARTQERTVGFFTFSDPGLTLQPSYGPVGTVFTISGTDLGNEQGGNTVTIGNATATVSSWADNQIKAAVPVGAVSGQVVIRLRGQDRIAGYFPVSRAFSLIPERGTVGSTVKVTGEGFGPAGTVLSVTMTGGVSANVTSWSETGISFQIPAGAQSGPVTAKIHGLDVVLGNISLHSITSLSASAGLRGQPVTLSGAGFGNSIGSGAVTFNGFNASIVSWSANQIVCTVPASATTGNVIVRIQGLDSNGVKFRPVGINFLSVDRGQAGSVISIYGTGFGNIVGYVDFGSAQGNSFLQWSDSRIDAVVPDAATGVATITVISDVLNSDSRTFYVANVTGVSPMTGWVGREIELVGQNFGASQGTNKVSFNGIDAPVVSWQENSIRVRVPVGATSGSLTLTFSGYARDLGEFTVVPVTLFTQVGSSWSGPRTESAPNLPGVAVDSAGNIFITDADNDWLWKFDSVGSFITRVGNPGSGEVQLDSPWGIAVDSSDNIYIADTNNHRIQMLAGSGDFLGWYGKDTTNAVTWHAPGSGRFPKSGAGVGEFSSPTGVFVDSGGNIFVSDTGNNRLQKFTSAWGGATVIGAGGTGPGQLNDPHGLCVDAGGNIYVADTSNERVQMFNGAGVFQKWFGMDTTDVTGSHVAGNSKSGSVSGAYWQPYDVKLDTGGQMIVSESGNGRVQIMKTDGTTVALLGEKGSGLGQYSGAYSVFFKNNVIYVADTLNHRVQKVNAANVFLGAITPDTTMLTNLPIRVAVDSIRRVVYVLDKDDSSISKFDSDGNFLFKLGTKGSGNGQLYFPGGINLDNSGNIYIADSGNARIQVFDPDFNYLRKWGSFGTGDGQFRNPVQVAVNPAGTEVYVADRDNHRIQKFDGSGALLAKWGSLGNGDNQFNQPNGVAIDSASNTLYVADRKNHRVMKYKTDGTFLGWWGLDTLSITGWKPIGSGRTPDFGNQDGQFDEPLDVQVDNEGSVYVLSLNNNDMQKFGSDQSVGADGNYQARIDSAVGFWGMAVDAFGALYLSNDNNQIEKYLPDI